MSVSTMSKSRENTLKWIHDHMDELKVDNESEAVDEMVSAMDGKYIRGSIGLSREMLEGKPLNENRDI